MTVDKKANIFVKTINIKSEACGFNVKRGFMIANLGFADNKQTKFYDILESKNSMVL